MEGETVEDWNEAASMAKEGETVEDEDEAAMAMEGEPVKDEVAMVMEGENVEDDAAMAMEGEAVEEEEVSVAMAVSVFLARSPAKEKRWKGLARASTAEEGEVEEDEDFLRKSLGERERALSCDDDRDQFRSSPGGLWMSITSLDISDCR